MSRYDTVQEHHAMIFDDQRNGIYARAIKQKVDNKSVVLDLGSGLGIHGLIAARAGAKKSLYGRSFSSTRNFKKNSF